MIWVQKGVIMPDTNSTKIKKIKVNNTSYDVWDSDAVHPSDALNETEIQSIWDTGEISAT